jgi:hypothetical protein
MQGTATFCPHGPADNNTTHQVKAAASMQDPTPTHLSEGSSRQQLHAAGEGEKEQLVVLQLLLPDAVLSGQLTSTSPEHQAAVAAALPWADASQAGKNQADEGLTSRNASFLVILHSLGLHA